MLKGHLSYSVLVVEDNLGDFFLVDELLKEEIHFPQIVHAKTFLEAKNSLLSNETFDVILLDLSLPDMEGEKLIKSVQEVANNTPIIVLTGYTEIKFATKAISLGVSDYLLKDELNSALLFKCILYSFQRQKVLNELKLSEKRYLELFQLSPQPIFVISPEKMQFELVNHSATQNYGYSKDEFKELAIYEILPKNVHDKFQILEKEEFLPFFLNIGKHKKKDKTTIDVSINYNSIQYQNQACYLFIINDITEKKSMDIVLTQAIIDTQEKERSEISADLHDNICQVLASCIYDINLLKITSKDLKKEYIDHLEESIQLSLTEIRNLSYQISPNFIYNLSLYDAFERLFLSPDIKDKYKYELNISEKIKDIELKTELKINLYRILQEQLRNINKYSKANLIQVSLCEKNDELYYSIKDNGKGFDINNIEYGLGFFNFKKRVDLFSGSSEIISSPNKGCEIRMTIPLEKIFKSSMD
ncbi:MAG: response regulator [Flavobacteriia bacterium]|nr:response regulator [Flavobacteriia bacterium]